MNRDELLKIINALSAKTEQRITRSIDTLDKEVRGLQGELLNLMLNDFVSKLSLTNGVVDASAANIAQIAKLDRLFAKFQQNFVDDSMKGFATQLLDIAALNGTYYNALGFDKKLITDIAAANDAIKARIGVEGAKNKVVPGSFLDSLAQTPEVKQQLKTLLLAQMSSGKSVADVTRALGDFIVGNRKDVDGALVRYYRQYAYDTYNQIHEIKNQEFAQGLGLEYFIYVGSVIATTRRFCSKKAGKIFTTQEAEQWRNDPDLVNTKSRSAYVPLVERGRFNCRHMIKYISEDMARYLDPSKFKEAAQGFSPVFKNAFGEKELDKLKHLQNDTVFTDTVEKNKLKNEFLHSLSPAFRAFLNKTTSMWTFSSQRFLKEAAINTEFKKMYDFLQDAVKLDSGHKELIRVMRFEPKELDSFMKKFEVGKTYQFNESSFKRDLTLNSSSGNKNKDFLIAKFGAKNATEKTVIWNITNENGNVRGFNLNQLSYSLDNEVVFGDHFKYKLISSSEENNIITYKIIQQ